MKIFKSKFELLFFAGLFVIAAVGTICVYAFKFNGPPIRSDGLGYYVYLPSTFIYKDITLNKFVETYSKHYKDEITYTWNGATKYKDTNYYLNKYPVGVAVMSAPFFLTAHIATLFLESFTNIKADGFSSPLYHVAQSASSTLYALLGLFILKRILDKHFKSKVTYLTILVITFGTNLFQYMTYDATFSHSYSFFLFAAFFYLTLKWYKKPKYITSVELGLVTGLIALVRPTNLIIILFFILYGLKVKDFKNILKFKFSNFLKEKLKLFTIAATALIIFSIQIAYWYSITGELFVYSYGKEGFNFSNPQIANVLFSIRKGFFFWSPILLISIIGFYLLIKRFKKHSIALFTFLFVNLWIVSSWWHWPYGGGFGMRALIESLAFFGIPIALVIEKIFLIKNNKLKRLIFLAITMCILFTLVTMIQYWRSYIPIDGTDFKILINALTNKKS